MSNMRDGTGPNRISGSTLFAKRVFPVVWFGGLAVFFVTALRTGDGAPMSLVAPPIMALVGALIFRNVWALADEVWDGGDHLVFRRGDLKQTVQLIDITNIDYIDSSATNSPRRVTVHVRSKGPLGKKVSFSLPASVLADLIQRADRARQLPHP